MRPGLLDRGARLANPRTAFRSSARCGQFDPSFFRLEGGLESRYLRGAIMVFLLALSLRFYLARYEMVYDDHGFMVGIDYVDQNVALPLQWLVIVACLAAAVLVWLRRWILAACMAISLVIAVRRARALVSALYVRPNEISHPAAFHPDPHPRDALAPTGWNSA